MKDNCCKGAVQVDDSGCYHWCEPKGGLSERIEDWSACISDNVYIDSNFGQACNSLGELEVKSALSQDEKPPTDARSAAAPGLSASWKVGVLLGLVGLVQVIA